MNYLSPEDRLTEIGAIDVPLRPLNGHNAPDQRTAAPISSPSFAASPFSLKDPAHIPPRAFVYGRHLIRKHVSVTVAPGGLGKSALTLAEAVSMAAGRPMLGETISKPLRVWVWNLEDPRDELERRLCAICQHYGITTDDLGGRLFVDSGREQELCTAVTAKGGAVLQEPVIDRLVSQLQRNRIDVLIVDPFISSHQVSENDNPAMDMVAKAWGRVADQAHAAISLVHHTRKASPDGETNADSARGAKALVDAARDVRCLTRMTKEEGENAGVDNHRAYFRVYSDKANLAPPAERSDWYQLTNVELANTDHVGVVTPWAWPDPMEGMKAADLLSVQRAIDGKNYRQNVQAADWVGKAVGEVLDLDPADQHDRARIKHCITSWLSSGALVASEMKDEKGKKRPIIEVGEWAI